MTRKPGIGRRMGDLFISTCLGPRVRTYDAVSGEVWDLAGAATLEAYPERTGTDETLLRMAMRVDLAAPGRAAMTRKPGIGRGLCAALRHIPVWQAVKNHRPILSRELWQFAAASLKHPSLAGPGEPAAQQLREDIRGRTFDG